VSPIEGVWFGLTLLTFLSVIALLLALGRQKSDGGGRVFRGASRIAGVATLILSLLAFLTALGTLIFGH
jgi:hypothetical protein